MLTALLAVTAGAVTAITVVASAHDRRTRHLWWLGAAASAAGAVAIVASDAPVPVGSTFAGAGLAAAAVVDGVEGRIPSGTAYGTVAAAGCSLVAAAVLSGDAGVAVRAALLTAVLVAAFGALWLAHSIGFGDVRLAAGTATAMLGSAAALVLLVWVGALAVGSVALSRRVRALGGGHDDRAGLRLPVPFAPALALGWLVAVLAT